MKDSTQHSNEAEGHKKGQGWEDPAFIWENMQEGIFGKIVEEDPDFFKEKRRRRPAIWFWFCVVILAGGGLYHLFSGGGTQLPPTTPAQSIEPKASNQGQPQVSSKNAVTKIHDSTVAKNQKIAATPKQSTSAKPKAIESKSFLRKNEALIISIADGTPNSVKTTENQVVAQQKTPTTFLPINPTEKKLVDATEALAAVKLRAFVLPIAVPTALPILEKQRQETKTERIWTVSADAGSPISFSKYTGSSAAVSLRNDHTTPWFGYQYGVGISASVAKKGELFLNLNRQVAFQNIDIFTERKVNYELTNQLLAINHYVVGGKFVKTYGDTTVNATEKNRLVHYNEQKSVQAQLGYAWVLRRKSWHFSLDGGLAVGFLAKQDGFTVAADGAILDFNNSQPIFRKIQYAPFAGLGVERKLGDRFAVKLHYQFQQQVNNSSLEADMDFRPMFHSLTLGASMKITRD